MNPSPEHKENNEMKPILKSCPFCDGTAYIERKGTTRQSMIIMCEDCGCTVESGDVYERMPPEIYQWNLRAYEERRPAPVVAESATMEASHSEKLEGLIYALGIVNGRRVLNRPPAYLAALNEIKIFLEAAIERVEQGEPMHSTATCQATAIQEVGKVEERLWDTRDIESLSLKCQLAKANASLLQAQQEIRSFEEREGKACPEDVGFEEYIGILKKQLLQAQAENAVMREALEEEHTGGCDIHDTEYPNCTCGYTQKVINATSGTSSRAMIEEMERLREFVVISGKFGGYAKTIENNNQAEWMEGFWEYFKEFEDAFDALPQAALNPQKKGDES